MTIGMNVSAIDADRQRQIRPGQFLPIVLTTIDEKEKDLLFTQLFIDSPAYSMHFVADRGRIEGIAQRQNLCALPAGLLDILKIMIYAGHNHLHGDHFADLLQFAFKLSPAVVDWISIV